MSGGCGVDVLEPPPHVKRSVTDQLEMLGGPLAGMLSPTEGVMDTPCPRFSGPGLIEIEPLAGFLAML
jgi:hypothetical protein